MRIFNASTVAATSPRRALTRSFTLLAAGIVLAAGMFVPAHADAVSLADKRAQAAKLDRDVAKLEDRYGSLQERWRGALVELDEIRDDAADAKVKLRAARKDLRGAKGRLEDRAIAIYREGTGSSELLQLVEAGSIRELFDRLDTMQRVGDQDVDILTRIRTAAKRVQRQEQRLQRAKTRQVKVVKRAATSKKKMSKVLSQKRARLNSVTSEIRSIMEAQRAAAARAETRNARDRAQRIASGEDVGAAPSNADGAGDAGAGTEPAANGAVETPAPTVPLPPASGGAAAAASIAMGKVGTPYQYGAAGPNAFDCSGLVMWAFAQAGRPGLPHSTYSLIGMGVSVPLAQAQVGDLVFTNGDGHMGIYVGGGSFVHAPRTGRNVTVESLGNYTITAIRRI